VNPDPVSRANAQPTALRGRFFLCYALCMDIFADICPLCGKPIDEGAPWTIYENSLVHEHCAIMTDSEVLDDERNDV
jgi:predicted Fe-S protein YdhL (DUF1289 family)